MLNLPVPQCREEEPVSLFKLGGFIGTRYVRAVMLPNACSFFAVCVWTSTFAASRTSIVPLPSTILPL